MQQVQVQLTSNTAEQDVSGNELLVNVYPRQTTGTKYPFNLIGTPGLAFFLELPTFPVVALHLSEGRAFAATKTKLYEIFANGSFNELGNVILGDSVTTADNGNQLVLVDGFRGFAYDFTLNVVTEIVDDGFYPARTVTTQDGYFIFERKGTGQFFISQLLSDDFDALDFATAEGQPDNLVGLISDHRELLLFGTRSTEIWYNSGAADFPFERNQGAFIEKGCVAPYTIAKQNNTVYWVGSDLMVYQMQGYTPLRISNYAVEKTLKGVNLEDAFAYTYQEEGALFYVLTIPCQELTWCYDIASGSWHIRRDYQFGRHRSMGSIFFDGKTLVGDFQSGRIYEMVQNHYLDDGEPIVREFVLPTINQLRQFMTIYSFELDMQNGVGLIQGQGSDPLAWLRYSKDGGKTFSNWKEARLGKIGEYLTRAKWNRLGAARQFTIHVRISDPVPIDIGGAYIEID